MYYSRSSKCFSKCCVETKEVSSLYMREVWERFEPLVQHLWFYLKMYRKVHYVLSRTNHYSLVHYTYTSTYTSNKDRIKKSYHYLLNFIISFTTLTYLPLETYYHILPHSQSLHMSPMFTRCYNLSKHISNIMLCIDLL